MILSRGFGSAAVAISITPYVAATASANAQHALDLIMPMSSSISHPPWFSSSPEDRASPLLDSPGSPSSQLAPLFVAAKAPLLSPPLVRRRPACRRLTLVGMAVVRTLGGVALRKASERVKARRKVAPVAQAAESLLCRGLGIIKDGEVCTEATLQELARHFEGQINNDVFAALRALF
jgi:hypothetical protein